MRNLAPFLIFAEIIAAGFYASKYGFLSLVGEVVVSGILGFFVLILAATIGEQSLKNGGVFGRFGGLNLNGGFSGFFGANGLNLGAIFSGFGLVLGGFLLILPGLLTDFLGGSLAVFCLIWQFFAKISRHPRRTSSPQNDDIIDVEVIEK